MGIKEIVLGRQKKRNLPMMPMGLSKEEERTHFEQVLVENAKKLAKTLEKGLREGKVSSDDPDLMIAASLYFYGVLDDDLIERLDNLFEQIHINGAPDDQRMLMVNMLHYVLSERGVDLS